MWWTVHASVHCAPCCRGPDGEGGLPLHGMCPKYASGDADFLHCVSADLSFSFFLLAELWKQLVV